jgi:hypothetical protein
MDPRRSIMICRDDRESKMNSKLKMTIVGAGIWGENHAQIYQAHPFCEVAAVCDEKEEISPTLRR